MDKKSEKKDFKILDLFWILFILLFFTFFLGACTSKKQQANKSKLITYGQILTAKPKTLQSGLIAFYKDGLWRHIFHMPREDEFLTGRTSAEPIEKIDHRFGSNEIFGSGKKQGVGVQMMGYIHLEHKGSWEFKAKSNDGIEIKIAGTRVAFDPDVHSDSFSKPINYSVSKPGWYPIIVRYFQRKGTATLEFYWKSPADTQFEIIPESAYWHIPDLIK